MKKVLVTGAAGFIGSALTKSLAQQGYEVTGIDNINSYYDPRLKIDRLADCGIVHLNDCFVEEVVPENGSNQSIRYSSFPFNKTVKSSLYPNLRFIRLDITDRSLLPDLFNQEKFDYVVNLAAQAGVRYSIKNPWAYVDTNINGFLNVLECCRMFPVKHLVYASSSSVYGLNENAPYQECDKVDNPVSLYAATKKSNELMAYSYSKLYAIPVTGLRYFTVYGPWGRPDMAPMLFANAIFANEPINVFNYGNMIRDFTFIDDIVSGTSMAMEHCPDKDENEVPAIVYNIGCGHPVRLMDFVSVLENEIGIKANINYLPMQQGDVYMTNADTTLLETKVGYKTQVRIEDGIRQFVEWYKHYFGL